MSTWTALTPDYKVMLSSFLLGSYFAALSDPRFSATDRMKHRILLEMEIERLSALEKTSVSQLAFAIDQMFASQMDYAANVPAIEWYIDFLLGRGEAWIKEVEPRQLANAWRSLVNDAPVRERILSTILYIDLVRDPTHPDTSAIVALFKDAEGLQASGQLDGDCRMIAQVLIQEAAASPESMTHESASRNVRYFALRLLRSCLISKLGDGPEARRSAVNFALQEIEDLGNRRAEFERILAA